MNRTRAFVLSLGGAAFLLSGCGRPAKTDTADASAAAPVGRTGEQIYAEYCAVCHMVDGSGVPNFQPALVNNPIVMGDATKLEAVIRAGSAALMDREPMFAAEMPPFGNLSEDELHAVVAYVRARFGAAASETSTP
jgi:mono/diheme cytochrome c family protein